MVMVQWYPLVISQSCGKSPFKGKSSSIIYKLAIVSVKSPEGIPNGHFDNDKPLDGIGSPMFRKT